MARGAVEASEVEVSALAINATIPEELRCLVAMVNAAADRAGALWGGHRDLS